MVRLTCKINEDITANFSLISTSDHIGSNKDVMEYAKDNDYDNGAIDDVDDYDQGSCVEKGSMYNGTNCE